jgi:hypothetical protein
MKGQQTALNMLPACLLSFRCDYISKCFSLQLSTIWSMFGLKEKSATNIAPTVMMKAHE